MTSLSLQNYEIIEVPRDGDCFFTSILKNCPNVFGDEESYLERKQIESESELERKILYLRNKLADYLESHLDKESKQSLECHDVSFDEQMRLLRQRGYYNNMSFDAAVTCFNKAFKKLLGKEIRLYNQKRTYVSVIKTDFGQYDVGQQSKKRKYNKGFQKKKKRGKRKSYDSDSDYNPDEEEKDLADFDSGDDDDDTHSDSMSLYDDDESIMIESDVDDQQSKDSLFDEETDDDCDDYDDDDESVDQNSTILIKKTFENYGRQEKDRPENEIKDLFNVRTKTCHLLDDIQQEYNKTMRVTLNDLKFTIDTMEEHDMNEILFENRNEQLFLGFDSQKKKKSLYDIFTEAGRVQIEKFDNWDDEPEFTKKFFYNSRGFNKLRFNNCDPIPVEALNDIVDKENKKILKGYLENPHGSEKSERKNYIDNIQSDTFKQFLKLLPTHQITKKALQMLYQLESYFKEENDDNKHKFDMRFSMIDFFVHSIKTKKSIMMGLVQSAKTVLFVYASIIQYVMFDESTLIISPNSKEIFDQIEKKLDEVVKKLGLGEKLIEEEIKIEIVKNVNESMYDRTEKIFKKLRNRKMIIVTMNEKEQSKH